MRGMQRRQPAQGNRYGSVSVSELTLALKGFVEEGFRRIVVHGEAISVKAVQSGHLYFSLKDPRAVLPCVIWKSTLDRIGVTIADGAQVVVYGDIQIYPPQGRYQLIVRRIIDTGHGELLMRLEALKRRLAAEGLFDPKRKRPLPRFPRRVGIITAETGAAVRDILTTIRRRYPADVLLCPVRVQGEHASREIVGALERLSHVDGVDVIIVGRGGGSLEDLWAFNDERVVRTIAATRVPVISAVGHEIDMLLSDLVADVRAPTPTAAGELVVPDRGELSALVDRLGQASARAMHGRIDYGRRRLLNALSRLRDPARLVAERQQALDERFFRLRTVMDHRVGFARRRLNLLEGRLRNLHPRESMRASRGRLEALEARLRAAIQRRLTAHRQAVERSNRTLQVLSPRHSLERGYAIVRTKDGAVLRDAGTATSGQGLTVVLHRGALGVTVEHVELDDAEAPSTRNKG